MTDPMPASLSLAAPPQRDRRIVLTASVSVLVHLALLATLVLPRLQPADAGDPAAIAVELVPPAPALQSASSSEMPSAEPESSQPPSSASASTSEGPSSAAPASEPPSAQPASAAPSSAAAAAASAERPASVSKPSEALAASSAQPVRGARPVVIPVGPSAVSSDPSAEDTASASDPSTAASEPPSAPAAAASAEASALTTTDSAASDVIGTDSISTADAASASDGPLPPGSALMHAAKRLYLASILSAPGMARAKAAIKTLPAQRRLTQTCMLEAIGQIGNAGEHYRPDALVNNAFAEPSSSGTSFSATGAAFRSGGRWYAISYACTLSKDLSAVTAFSYHLGEDVTAALKARGDG